MAFASPLHAVRCAFVIQMALVLQNWPSEVMNLCGPLVPGPDQIPLFNGPRVAIAIHCTSSFGVSLLPSGTDSSNRITDYAGHGVLFARKLAAVAHGGQTVLSGRTWKMVQDSLPPRAQVCLLCQDFWHGWCVDFKSGSACCGHSV